MSVESDSNFWLYFCIVIAAYGAIWKIVLALKNRIVNKIWTVISTTVGILIYVGLGILAVIIILGIIMLILQFIHYITGLLLSLYPYRWTH